MAIMFGSDNAARRLPHEAAPSCGGWVESSFDLHQGVEVTEDIDFTEFERLRELAPTPQALVSRWPDRSLRKR